MESIKFRIFHKSTKTIQTVALIDFNNSVLDTYGITEPIYNIPFNECIILPFTGLQDKNGKDIYRGDILKLQSDDNQITQLFHSDNEDWLSAFNEQSIIIGNHYKNPELLEVNND